jgi:hypothetical protein
MSSFDVKICLFFVVVILDSPFHSFGVFFVAESIDECDLFMLCHIPFYCHFLPAVAFQVIMLSTSLRGIFCDFLSGIKFRISLVKFVAGCNVIFR